MSGRQVVALDLGATSGRVIVGDVSSSHISMQTTGRFLNRPVRVGGRLQWDVLGLWRGALDGLAAAARTTNEIASIGVDSWGVDYALLREGRLLANPTHYRDERSLRGMASLTERIGRDELFALNGLQHMPINTINQLASGDDTELLGFADTLVMIPGLFDHLLCGVAAAERTNASTTGLLDVRSGEWHARLASAAGVAGGVLGDLVDAGVRLGSIRSDVAAETGLAPSTLSITVGSHDTASAVVAVPMDASRAAYVSCGTWGLVGVEVAQPVLTDEAREAAFTNEGGVDGRIRLLHNVMGLWLLSETVRWWERDGVSVDLPELLAAAADVSRPVPVFDVDDDVFLTPGDMPGRIAAWCTERGLEPPQTRAEFTRSIVESLATAFARTALTAGRLGGVDIDTIHIVGGGALNTLLCQRTADHAGVPVHAGPVEATAIGNLLVQARAIGELDGSLEALRDLVGRTQHVVRFEPRG